MLMLAWPRDLIILRLDQLVPTCSSPFTALENSLMNLDSALIEKHIRGHACQPYRIPSRRPQLSSEPQPPDIMRSPSVFLASCFGLYVTLRFNQNLPHPEFCDIISREWATPLWPSTLASPGGWAGSADCTARLHTSFKSF